MLYYIVKVLYHTNQSKKMQYEDYIIVFVLNSLFLSLQVNFKCRSIFLHGDITKIERYYIQNLFSC